MCVFPCIVLTPFEPWFVIVLLITVCCTDSVDLSLWSGWLLSCFCCPFSRVCGLRMSLTWRWTICSPSDHHQPMVRQKCLRWLNRRKTAPVAFPARTTMPAGKLWTSSEFPEGCSAHLELRAEKTLPSLPYRGGAVTLKLEKKSVKIRGICVTLWIEDYKIGVNLCNLWANVKKKRKLFRPPKIVPKTLAYHRKNE